MGPVFTEGQVVEAMGCRGYPITLGKHYTVLEYIPANHCDGFTFPPYVKFVDDDGNVREAHASRFRSIE